MNPLSPEGRVALRKYLRSLFAFAIWGLPGFLTGFGVNFALVEGINCPKSLAYILAQAALLTVNFQACRWIVFPESRQGSLWLQMKLFLSGTLLLRFLDWAVYTLLISFTPFHYLLIQVGNLVLFMVIRHFVSSRIFQAKTAGDSSGG